MNKYVELIYGKGEENDGYFIFYTIFLEQKQVIR